MSDVDVGQLYRVHRERVTEMVRPVPEGQLLMPCPACPGWSVHDVVSHLAGIAADAIAGKLAGPPPPEQTAEQVEQRRGQPTTVVLREWERSASQFELVLTKTGMPLFAAAIDVTTHEHDIRGALGLDGDRDDEVVRLTAERTLARWSQHLQATGLAVPAVVRPDGAPLQGDAAATLRWEASEYEVFRTALGRRSAAQFARAFTGADPAPYLDALLVFGITEFDLSD